MEIRCGRESKVSRELLDQFRATALASQLACYVACDCKARMDIKKRKQVCVRLGSLHMAPMNFATEVHERVGGSGRLGQIIFGRGLGFATVLLEA